MSGVNRDTLRDHHLKAPSSVTVSGYYAIALTLYVFGLIYGSWLPFRFRHLETGAFEEQLRAVLMQPLTWSAGADFLGNAVLGVVLGFAACGALRELGGGMLFRIAAALVLCGVVSVTAEVGQIWIEMRVPSSSDVVAQLSGALIGCLAELAFGRSLDKQLRQICTNAGTAGARRRLCRLYVWGYLIYALLPLDGLQPHGEIGRRVEEVIQFGTSPPVDRSWAAAFGTYAKKICIYVPFGIAICGADRIAFRILRAIGIGIGAAAFVETGQIFLRSSSVDAFDLVCGAIGAALGAWFVMLADGIERLLRSDPVLRRQLGRLAGWAALGYFAVLTATYCYPLERINDARHVVDRVGQFFSWPLAALWQGSNANAAGQVALKLTTFGVLGGLLSVRDYLLSVPPRSSLLRVVALTSLAGVTIEFAQIWSPQRYPDAFDAVLAGAGGLAAHFVLLFFLPPASPFGNQFRECETI